MRVNRPLFSTVGEAARSVVAQSPPPDEEGTIFLMVLRIKKDIREVS